MRSQQSNIRLAAFDDRLGATSLSQSELCAGLRISRYSLWRRLKSAPWQRHRGAHDEDRLFDRLARLLTDSKDRLLWLAGYNPFVGRGLTLRQMELLFEIITKLIHAVKQETFDGDLGKLSTIAAEDLAGLAATRPTRKAAGKRKPPQVVVDAMGDKGDSE